MSGSPPPARADPGDTWQRPQRIPRKFQPHPKRKTLNPNPMPKLSIPNPSTLNTTHLNTLH